MRSVIKAKDFHFNAMMIAKDAKIMNLVEGTDLQKLMMKHSLEMEQQGAKHERHVELAKEACRAECQVEIDMLHGHLQDQAKEVEKHQQQLLNWEKRMEETMLMVKKQKQQHLLKEERAEQHLQEVQDQLSQAFVTVEELIQTKVGKGRGQWRGRRGERKKVEAVEEERGE
jgi:hypothetical protein